MLVLKKITGEFPAICGCLDDWDRRLCKEFDTVRTLIWTKKYEEPRSIRGYEKDEHDSDSYRIALIRENVRQCVVGGCRIIKKQSEYDLPTAVNVAGAHRRLLQKRQGVEISRFFLALPQTNSIGEVASVLLRELVDAIEMHLVGVGYECAYATIRFCLYEKLQAMHVPMVRLGVDATHGSRSFVPVRITMRESIEKRLLTEQIHEYA